MKISLWRGYHSPKLIELLSEALQGKRLVILCPPHLHNYDFLNKCPEGVTSLVGEWPQNEREKTERAIAERSALSSFETYPQVPHIGVFTSGTMSTFPSLVFFRKEQVEDSLQSILELFKNEWAERIICYPQPFHIFGLTLGYLQSILWKKPLLTPDGQYKKSFHDVWLREEKAGLLTLGAPVHFFDLLQRIPEYQKREVSSSICGGARVTPELWNDFQNKLGIEYPSIGYGATEACPGLSHLPPGIVPQENGDIGNWLKGVEAIPNPEGYEFSGPNKCIAIIEENKDGGMRLHFPKSILIRDDIVKSGDRLIYKGRSDLKMNRGGEKFSLELIEEKLKSFLKIPLVTVALADSRLGEKLGIAIQRPTDSGICAKEIKNLCKDFIASEFTWSMQESDIIIQDELPLSPNGKLDRRKVSVTFLQTKR